MMTTDIFNISGIVKMTNTSDPSVKTCTSFPIVMNYVLDEVEYKLIGAATAAGPMLITAFPFDLEDADDDQPVSSTTDLTYEQLEEMENALKAFYHDTTTKRFH